MTIPDISRNSRIYNCLPPKELSAPGIRDFREVFFKPYRIIHRVQRRNVYVYHIAECRRDMQTLPSRRLLTD